MCKAKVESGEVSEQYIEVAKQLLEVENQYQSLQKVRLDNVLDAGGFLVLVVGKGDAAKINADPKLTRDPWGPVQQAGTGDRERS